MRPPVSLPRTLDAIPETWSPRIVGQVNDAHLKVARIEGDFVWHSHADTDEAFYVVEGEMTLELRDGEVKLRAGDLWVVPRGVEHRPRAERECRILLVERAGTQNTGDAGGPRTAPERWA